MNSHQLSNDPGQQALYTLIQRSIANAGGWLGFDRFMALALYAPGMGYYANSLRKFGLTPESGSDFATAPEMSPHFGRTLAHQVREALAVTRTDEVWEFGAGSGALAKQLLDALGDAVQRYTIVDLSGSLRARQQDTLKAHAHQVRWVDALPEQLSGVVVGNEVLDAMPVQLLVRKSGVWHERGVVWHENTLQWADRVTDLRPPVEVLGDHDYLTEIHSQAEAFVATLADRFKAGEAATGHGGAAFLIDYGFPEGEYFHPQRHMGTLMCHQLHKSDTDPLQDVGAKDITAHVNFTGVALAAQDAGLHVLGYTTQAHFLINCGLLPPLVDAPVAEKAMAQKLITEHEMGELFKVVALGTSEWEPMGFAQGDRSHTL
ncbi:SAM-dependent methyltransferase [Limnohabitans sp.]|uniref:class I SAM-dependent methyltransferase n=1 Tax=Limnohabitans sp. TaxID=1907725 RepID=UPI00286EEE28|nr:SAM-dependent methyltransferase [Limnohabitans sp.]